MIFALWIRRFQRNILKTFAIISKSTLDHVITPPLEPIPARYQLVQAKPQMTNWNLRTLMLLSLHKKVALRMDHDGTKNWYFHIKRGSQDDKKQTGDNREKKGFQIGKKSPNRDFLNLDQSSHSEFQSHSLLGTIDASKLISWSVRFSQGSLFSKPLSTVTRTIGKSSKVLECSLFIPMKLH